MRGAQVSAREAGARDAALARCWRCGREYWAGWFERAVRGRGGSGPAIWLGGRERRGRRPGPVSEFGLEHGLQAGLGWVSFSFSICYFNLTQPIKLFEFKFEFEFNPNTQTNKLMHQHECNNKILALDKILITCDAKLD